VTVAPFPFLVADCLFAMQVNILQRHGQRFPTSGAGAGMKTAIAALQNGTLTGSLSFISSYNFTLGVDDLTPGGAAELYDAGLLDQKRYGKLGEPFVRTDSQQRVVDSATNWTSGFLGVKKAESYAAPLILDNTAGVRFAPFPSFSFLAFPLPLLWSHHLQLLIAFLSSPLLLLFPSCRATTVRLHPLASI
jgi:hypothetical protein